MIISIIVFPAVITLLALVVLYFLLSIRIVSNWVQNHFPQLENLRMIVSILAFTSLAFSVTTYIIDNQKTQQIEDENRIIYLQNAKKEINEDVRIIQWIRSNLKEFQTTDHTILTRFIYNSLNNVVTFYKDKNVREVALVTIYDLNLLNRLLDEVQNIQAPNQEKYFETKSDKLQKLIELLQEVGAKLSFLQKNLN